MKEFLFVLDKDGVRATTFIVGIHGDTMEMLKEKAKREFPNSTLVEGDYSMQVEFMNGKSYVKGKFVEAPKVEPPTVVVEPKEERIELDNLKVLEILAAQQEQIDALMEGK